MKLDTLKVVSDIFKRLPELFVINRSIILALVCMFAGLSLFLGLIVFSIIFTGVSNDELGFISEASNWLISFAGLWCVLFLFLFCIASAVSLYRGRFGILSLLGAAICIPSLGGLQRLLGFRFSGEISTLADHLEVWTNHSGMSIFILWGLFSLGFALSLSIGFDDLNRFRRFFFKWLKLFFVFVTYLVYFVSANIKAFFKKETVPTGIRWKNIFSKKEKPVVYGAYQGDPYSNSPDMEPLPSMPRALPSLGKTIDLQSQEPQVEEAPFDKDLDEYADLESNSNISDKTLDNVIEYENLDDHEEDSLYDKDQEEDEINVAPLKKGIEFLTTYSCDIDHPIPSIDLLSAIDNSDISNREPDKEQEELLLKVLSDFGVSIKGIRAFRGPVITLYEVEPEAGVKSSRIISLSDDIARSMSTTSARIAVVPGKNVIGIELPNRVRETVSFRGLIEDDKFLSDDYVVPIALGQNISGKPVYTDLLTMPHLLVGGSTGSGKSVGMHTMMLSFLFKMTAKECGFILIDPKRLEFMPYTKIPHLITPVVTDPQVALKALKWSTKEMENRYENMSRLGVRNIGSYNEKVLSSGIAEKMPFIIIMVDELADLMLVGGKDLEICLQRLAQMGRAAGIHLITATQRPSVDVLGGSVKVNLNTRIAFQMASKIDSRTILGAQGAEQLLGRGDMLYSSNQILERVHGGFVSEEDIANVVNFLGEYAKDFDMKVEDPLSQLDVSGNRSDYSDSSSEGEDELYKEAVELVLRLDKCSTSLIQRHMKIGYNRAARLVEEMESSGLVSPANHVGKREILSSTHKQN